MTKKMILLGGLLLAGLSNAQINLHESFEGPINDWANSELTGPVFVSSEQYFCDGTQAAGALISALLGDLGAGPKTMISPFSIPGNNNQKLDISYSVIIGEVNLTDFVTLDPIDPSVDWGYLKLYYSLDGGNNWTEFQNINSTNYTSTASCTEINVSIPAENMGSGDTGFLLKFEADRNSNYMGILVVVIDELSLQQESSLAVNESGKQKMQIFPNPVEDYFSFSKNTDERINSVSVFSAEGTLVKTIQNPSEKISVADLQKGFYIIKAKTNSSEQTFKIIKK